MTEATTQETADAPEEVADGPQEGQQAEPGTETQGGGETADGPEFADQPAEPVQPAEVVDEEEISRAVIETPAGSLTLRPNQKELDTEQHYALRAIGIDTASDPGVIPHLRAFIHMCQTRALDPFAREAYLIGRGKGDNRKWTMQTGIDGYRKMAKATGRFIRVKRTLWTGEDDDDRSYKMVEVDGDYIMKRVWYDQWPAARGNPGACKVVVEHYDDFGNVVTTEAVADWGMYAPYNDVWEGPRGSRHVKMVDGKPVQELSAMWQKGGPHMLAKCAEALAHRKAFPAAMSGVYVTEEMSRLDQQERDRATTEQAQARRDAYTAAQRDQQTGTPVVGDEGGEGEAVPTPAAEVAEEVLADVAANSEEVVGWLRAEFEYQAETLGQKPETLARRVVAKLRKNLDDFDAADLLAMVVGFRPMVVDALRQGGLSDADLSHGYVEAATDNEQPINWDEVTGDDNIIDVESVEIDPEQPHPYDADDDGVCVECGLAENVGPHPEGDES